MGPSGSYPRWQGSPAPPCASSRRRCPAESIPGLPNRAKLLPETGALRCAAAGAWPFPLAAAKIPRPTFVEETPRPPRFPVPDRLWLVRSSGSFPSWRPDSRGASGLRELRHLLFEHRSVEKHRLILRKVFEVVFEQNQIVLEDLRIGGVKICRLNG